MKTKHKHKAVPAKGWTRGYRGPVAHPENRAAHGGVCYVDVCRCGATRETNANQGRVERGPWVDAAEMDGGGR